MSYKRWSSAIFAFLICCMLTGCHINHEWQPATCTTPKTCVAGGETEGEALGHTWIGATCITPETCSVCGETEGAALGHTWVDATCYVPKTCNVCGKTEGEALGHAWVDATCSAPRACNVCGETEGETLAHTFKEANYQQPATCTACGETTGEPLAAYFEQHSEEFFDAELNVPYSFPVDCPENKKYITTGKVTFSDYETFASDETHEALEGYEWKAITVTFVYDDDNAWNYGYKNNLSILDYYSEDSYFEKLYTINYYGEDYDECIVNYENQWDGWVGRVSTDIYRFVMRVPKGYDGLMLYTPTDLLDVFPCFRLK